MELDMTSGNPLKLIAKFIIPLIVGNIFQQFYNMVDTIIVGRYVGVDALAAVGATGTIMFLIIGFMQGLTTGFTVLTSQRFGAGDEEGVKKSFGNAAVLSVIVTVLATIISIVTMKNLLTVMNTPADIFEQSYTYITVICMGLCCNILYNLLASVLRAVGNSKIPLYFLVLSAGINIVLDLLFIIKFQMGVAGAAWATNIAQGISGILCIIYMKSRVPLLKLRKEHWRLDEICVKNQLFIGIPMAMQFSITAVGTIIVQSSLNILGSTIVAAYTAANKVEQLVTQPFLAMGMTMATYSGQNRGVDDIARIKKGTNIASIMTIIYAVVIAFIVMETVPYAVKLFITGDATEIIGYAHTYMKICTTFYIPLGLIFVFRNVLQGMGFALMPMLGGVVELISRVAVAFIAAEYRSFEGICCANIAAWGSAALFLWIAYLVIIYRLVKRKKETMA